MRLLYWCSTLLLAVVKVCSNYLVRGVFNLLLFIFRVVYVGSAFRIGNRISTQIVGVPLTAVKPVVCRVYRWVTDVCRATRNRRRAACKVAVSVTIIRKSLFPTLSACIAFSSRLKTIEAIVSEALRNCS